MFFETHESSLHFRKYHRFILLGKIQFSFSFFLSEVFRFVNGLDCFVGIDIVLSDFFLLLHLSTNFKFDLFLYLVKL